VKIRAAHALFLVPLALAAIPLARWISMRNADDEIPVGTPVVVGQPRVESLEVVLSYPGNLAAESTATVVPRIGGRVEQVIVRENQRVRAGEPLVVLDDDVVTLQADQALAAWRAAQAQLESARRGVRPEELESAQATVHQAEKDIEVANANIERTRRLYEAGTVPKVDLENAENQVQNAETELENARRSLSLMEQGASTEELAIAEANADAAGKAYELARLQLDYATVSAPVSGTVARVMVEAGNSVGTSTPLLAIVNDDLIYANVAVPEKHYGQFSSRAELIPARIKPIAFDDDPIYDGTVTSVASVIDPASRTFVVKIAVDNRGGRLRPGMYVNVELVMDRVAEAITVPRSTVVFREGRTVVFAVERNSTPIARLVLVDAGITQDGRIQILSGIDTDDLVAFEGNAFLEDGQVVRPVNLE